MCSSASTNLTQSPTTSEMPPTPQHPRRMADDRLLIPRSVLRGGVLGLAVVTAPIHPALPSQPGDRADRLLRLRVLAHRLELEGAEAGESVVSNGWPRLSRSPDFPHSPHPSPTPISPQPRSQVIPAKRLRSTCAPANGGGPSQRPSERLVAVVAKLGWLIVLRLS
jgi:hypothetical protein